MSTSVTWDGTAYSVPAAGELNWASLSTFLIALGNSAAVASEMKQAVRIATSTPVTVSDTSDFGVVTALTVPAAVTVNLPAGTNGRIFAIVDGTGDAATNNVTITPNGSETINGSASLVLNHNRQGVLLQYSTTGTQWRVLQNFIPPGTIKNSDIISTAAIDHSKLANISSAQILMGNASNVPTATVVSGDITINSSGVTTISPGSIVNSMISGSAAITRTKLATGTASHVVIHDGSGNLSSEASLAISRGGTGQATQTAAFDALSPTTTKGDIIAYNGTDNVRLAVGTDGQVLSAASGQATGLQWTSALSNPMDSEGDLIVGGASGAATKLDHPGAANRLLKSTSTTALGYAQLVNADVDAAAAIAGSKLQAASASNVGTVSYEDAGSFTANFNSGATSNTNNVTVTYRRIGKMVLLEIPAVTNITMNLGGVFVETATNTIPATLIPQRDIEVNFRGRNNGSGDAVGTYGTAIFMTDRKIHIERSATWSAATANCGWTAFCVTYTVA